MCIFKWNKPISTDNIIAYLLIDLVSMNYNKHSYIINFIIGTFISFN